MTAAAKTTTATAAAMRPHGFCWVTTLTGGRVRPLPTCPPGAARRPAGAGPPTGRAAVVRPFSGLGSLATAAPRCAADPAACAADRAGHLAGGSECRCGACAPGAPRPALGAGGDRDGRGRRGGGDHRCTPQYARAVTPEQLSDVVRSAVAAVVERGALTVAVPDEVVIERPKNPEHGDYATNVALRLAKARRPAAARGGRAAGRRAARRRRRRDRGRRRAGLPQHHPRQGRAGPARRPGGHRGRGVRAHRHPGRAEAEPGVRLGQPDRAGAHRRHPLGRGRRRAGPAAHRQRGRGHPGVLLQRRRVADRPLRARACRPRRRAATVPEDGYAGDYIARHRRPGGRRRAGPARPARGRAAGGLPGPRRRADVGRDPGLAGRLRRGLRRLLLRADAARDRRAGQGDRPAARAGARLRVRRRGVAAHHRLRRRQGPGAGQERRRAHLLRRRLRLLPGQARPRLRQGRDHAGRRPHRLRRPVQGAGRGDGRRPGQPTWRS